MTIGWTIKEKKWSENWSDSIAIHPKIVDFWKNHLWTDYCQYNSIVVPTFDEHTKIPMLEGVYLIKSCYN